MLELLGIFATYVVASLLVQWIRRHHATSLEVHHRVQCGLRVVRGEYERLSAGWQWGTATVSPGQLSFSAMGIPFLKRKPVLIPVTVVHVARQRAKLPWETNVDSPNYVITPLGVPGATLDWAVPNNQLERATDDLRGV